MQRIPPARLLLVLVAVVLLTPTSALTRSPSPDPGGSRPSPVASFSPTTPDPDELASKLADLGIGVISSAVDRRPDGAPIVTVTRSQVAALAHEIAAGSGLPGWDLDRLTPMPDGAPPFSYLVAAWLDTAGTPRSQAARAWYADDTDWRQAPTLLYPTAALLLFTADAAEHIDRETPRFLASPVPAAPSTSPAAGIRLKIGVCPVAGAISM